MDNVLDRALDKLSLRPVFPWEDIAPGAQFVVHFIPGLGLQHHGVMLDNNRFLSFTSHGMMTREASKKAFSLTSLVGDAFALIKTGVPPVQNAPVACLLTENYDEVSEARSVMVYVVENSEEAYGYGTLVGGRNVMWPNIQQGETTWTTMAEVLVHQLAGPKPVFGSSHIMYALSKVLRGEVELEDVNDVVSPIMYDFLRNNCEHFATYFRFGFSMSLQADVMMNTDRNIFQTGWEGLKSFLSNANTGLSRQLSQKELESIPDSRIRAYSRRISFMSEREVQLFLKGVQ